MPSNSNSFQKCCDRIDVLPACIRGHGNYRCSIVKLPDLICRGEPIHLWHHNIHQDYVIFSKIHLIDGLESVLGNFKGATHDLIYKKEETGGLTTFKKRKEKREKRKEKRETSLCYLQKFGGQDTTGCIIFNQ